MNNWINLYSPKLHQEEIEKLLKLKNLNHYNFINNGYNDLDVLIEHGLYTYKLEIHENEEKLYVYRKSTFRSGQKGSKEYHTPIKVYHNDVWYNSIKFIVSKN